MDPPRLASPRGLHCPGPVGSLAFSPDGRLLACGHLGSGLIHFVDTARGVQRTWLFDSGNGTGGLAFAGEGKVLVSAGQTWSAWDLEAAGALSDREEKVPDDRDAAGKRNGKFRLRRFGLGWATSVVTLPGEDSCAAWEVVDHRDGRPQERAISVRSLRTGEEVRRLFEGGKGLGQVALADHGRLLVGRDEEGSVLVWELPAFRRRSRYQAPAGTRLSAIAAAAGKPLLALVPGNRVLLWDLAGDGPPEEFKPASTRPDRATGGRR